MFAMPRSGTSDGLHVDNDGRLWSAEYNGIVVRNSRGKGLSVFNVEQLVKDWEHSNPIVNFALAGEAGGPGGLYSVVGALGNEYYHGGWGEKLESER